LQALRLCGALRRASIARPGVGNARQCRKAHRPCAALTSILARASHAEHHWHGHVQLQHARERQRDLVQPFADVLNFDQTSISAASLSVAPLTNAVRIRVESGTDAGKFVDLQGMTELQLATSNVHFANGSLLLIGDNSTAQNDSGSNTLFGGSGNDFLFGLGGNDSLNGGSGNDWLSWEGGNTTMSGSGGQDAFAFGQWGGSESVTINDFAGNSWDSLRFNVAAFATSAPWAASPRATCASTPRPARAPLTMPTTASSTTPPRTSCFTTPTASAARRRRSSPPSQRRERHRGRHLVFGTPIPPSSGVITGTSGNDSLNGTASADTINGLGGNDTLTRVRRRGLAGWRRRRRPARRARHALPARPAAGNARRGRRQRPLLGG
jgi:hypothetical protein